MGKDLTDYAVSSVVFLKDLSSYVKDKLGISLKKKPKETRAVYKRGVSAKISELKYKRIATKYGMYIDLFENVLRNNIPMDLLQNFYKNINSANIYGLCFQFDDLLSNGGFAGRYVLSKNEVIIDLADKNNILSIYHELLHLASADRSNPNNLHLGLAFYKGGKYVMGGSLNEGYADLLTERYFGVKPAYDIEYVFSSLMEQTVGKEKMQECYFKADLRSLVAEYEKYDYMDNIVYFIKELDDINKDEETFVKHTRLNNIMYFLIRAYVIKQFREKGDVEQSYVVKDIVNYVKQIPREYKIKGNTYRIDIESIYNEVMWNVTQEIKGNYSLKG